MLSNSVKILLFVCLMFISLDADEIYELKTSKEIVLIAPIIPLGVYGYAKTHSQKDFRVEEIDKLSRTDINFFDRFATKYYSVPAKKASDYMMLACVVAPFTLNFDERVLNQYIEVNTIIVESFLITSTLATFTKVISQRKRPMVYNEDVGMNIRKDKENRYSFFSAHTALAFNGAILTAKIYNDYHPDKNNKWLYATGIATASTVGYLRLRAGKHYPTDIITGAVVGTASALLVTEIHKKRVSPANISISDNRVQNGVFTPSINLYLEW